jgi:hypothetical protein
MRHIDVAFSVIALLSTNIAFIRAEPPSTASNSTEPAQRADDVLLRGLQSIMSSTFNGQIINVLDSPIVLQSVFDKAPLHIPDFVVFDSVPKRSAFIFAPGESDVTKRLQLLVPEITLGKVTLTAEEIAALKKARGVLYKNDDDSQPTAINRKYHDLDAKRNKIRDKLKDPVNPPSDAEKGALQFELGEINVEWDKPWRAAVEESQDTIDSLTGPNKVGDQFTEWEKVLSKSEQADYGGVWDALSRQDGWIALTFPIKIDDGLAISGKHDADAARRKRTVIRADDITSLTLSMRVARVSVNRPALQHPFLTSRSWTAKTRVISNGDPTHEADIELVPRYVAELILVREIEIDFADSAFWRSSAAAIRSTTLPTIGGVTLSKAALFVSPQHLSFARPQVIGVIIRNMPRSPNPDQRLSFDAP